jgi:regulator of protease activity HflC (stomatin/prohibitin superfamily)
MMQDAAVTDRRSAERDAMALPGLLGLAGAVLFALAGLIALGTATPIGVLVMLICGVGVLASLGGLIVIQPNEAAVVVVFGSYQGTVRRSGFWWVNPLSFGQRQVISLRTRNFLSNTSKVNDANGNPINIAAVVVWQVVDTAPAVFDVEDYERFVFLQAETAIRHVARSYPYDDYGDNADVVTLTGNADEVADTLSAELQERLTLAGVHVVETRLTDLSYAPEIAEVMLRRQQASAVVAARQRIVEGAVGMVRLAVEQIEAEDIAHLTPTEKSALVSNLLTVLVSEAPTTPMVNVGPAPVRL